MFEETIKIIKSILEYKQMFSIYSLWKDKHGDEYFFNEILFDYESQIKNRHATNVYDLYPDLENVIYSIIRCDKEHLIKDGKMTKFKK